MVQHSVVQGDALRISSALPVGAAEIDAKPAVVGIAPLDFSPQRRPFHDGAP